MRYKLNQKDIEILKLIPDPFKKRDYLQELGIDYFQKSKGKLICTWATATGKTVLALKIIKKLQLKHTGEIHITVPTDILKEQWEKNLSDFKDVKVYTIHSYLKQATCVPKLLCCDEIHIGIATEEGEAFNKINDVPAPFKLYLSATLKKLQLKYLATKGMFDEFNIGISEALMLDLVPPLSIYNVTVPFTEKEKSDYVDAITRETKALDWFSFFNIIKLYNVPPIIPGENSAPMFYSYLRARSKRINLVTKASNKEGYVQKIVDFLKGRKIILFSTSQKQADEIHKLIPESTVYHTGIKKAKENYDKFINNEINIISSVGKLIAGLDDACTDSILRISFFSTESATKQSLGKQNLPK